MSRFLTKLKGKQILYITLVFILFTSIVLPYFASLTTKLIGVSESPDTGFGLSLSEYYLMRTAYGEYGRKVYVVMRFTFDIVWPVVYTVFLVSTLFYLQQQTQILKSIKLHYVAFTAVLFDFMENVLAVIFMTTYPNQIDFVVYLLKGSSMIKWGLIVAAFILIIILLGFFSYKNIIVKRQEKL